MILLRYAVGMARPRTLANADQPRGASAADGARPVTLEDATRAELASRGFEFVTLNRRGRHGVDLAMKTGSTYRILTIGVPHELESMVEIDDRLFDEIVSALSSMTARAG